MKLTLYGKENCSLCTDAYHILEILRQDFIFELEEVNIYNEDELLEAYHLMIPVLKDQETIIDIGIIDIETVENYLLSKNNSENS
ncbi:glutaredoxin family protein [Gracilibacillus caseinilyticus]|uniref:Glutaredoxin family protein n=1 Tax=Gracilibacillus caseinilyticus TaxID=2932256 RepID=A0ABY4EVB7_9BACI|nr:glutaredoxin family protein [Gracilibacillus caseinilyticus]UOQ48240.1 glutaredoxin family protein [Gracilibacillus caseinilyticus]